MSRDAVILDACCGARMFWFDRDRSDAVFMDNRELSTVLCDGRVLNIRPDIVGDFRAMPFPDDRFNLVVFDPPHLIEIGEKTWMAAKYGILSDNWKEDLRKGFGECMRVLRPGGVLIFKWSETQITIGEVIKAIGSRPLFGNRIKQTTIWLVYMKEA